MENEKQNLYDTNRVLLVVAAWNAVLRKILKLSLGSLQEECCNRLMMPANELSHRIESKTRVSSSESYVSIPDWGRGLDYIIFFRGMVWRQKSYSQTLFQSCFHMLHLDRAGDCSHGHPITDSVAQPVLNHTSVSLNKPMETSGSQPPQL